MVKYKIEFNPTSNTWCLYRYNTNYKQWQFKPIYQSIDKKKVEDALETMLKKKGMKVNERTF